MRTNKRQFDIRKLRDLTFVNPEAKLRCAFAAELRRQAEKNMLFCGVHEVTGHLAETRRLLQQGRDIERMESAQELLDAAQLWLHAWKKERWEPNAVAKALGEELEKAVLRLRRRLIAERKAAPLYNEVEIQVLYNANAMERNTGNDWNGYDDARR